MMDQNNRDINEEGGVYTISVTYAMQTVILKTLIIIAPKSYIVRGWNARRNGHKKISKMIQVVQVLLQYEA